MKLNNSTLLDILLINLDALKYGIDEALIVVDFTTVQFWLKHLENLEKYEDCRIIKNNEYRLVYKCEEQFPKDQLSLTNELCVK